MRILLTIAMIGITSCGRPQTLSGCRLKYIAAIRSDSAYAQVKRAFNDSLQKWIDLGIRPVQQFKDQEKFRWQLDDFILFNQNKTRAILFIDKIAQDSNRPPTDYVKTIGAEKLESGWAFYYLSYVEMYIPRDKNGFRPYTFDELIDEAILALKSDGLSFDSNCMPSYKWIDTDTWFDSSVRWMHRYVFLEKARDQ